MKRYINLFWLGLGMLGFLTSCEDKLVSPVLTDGAAPALTLSVQNIVLDKENAANNAVQISWSAPDFGFAAGVSYTLKIDKKGGDFSKGVIMGMGQSTSKTYKVSELNALLLGLGMMPGEPGDLDLMVEAVLGPTTVLTSPIASLKATAYLDRLDLSSPWGLVGSATPNGWNGPDVPFYKTAEATIFVAYATLVDGEMKIRQNNSWDLNYGDDGNNGSLEQNGANILVQAGTYRITFNAAALSIKLERYSWGLVGSATANGWDGPDMPLNYDPTTDTWRALVMLNEGEMKIRRNNDWSVNFGDDGANGTLEAGGANIAVKKGSYLISVDFNKNTYTVEPTNIFGIVGSATATGWDGPDAKFSLDFTKEGVWVINNITLKDGEIKFRQNDAWTVNYGDNGADLSLEKDGANIVVQAGRYDIVLDFGNPNAPTYKMTKK